MPERPSRAGERKYTRRADCHHVAAEGCHWLIEVHLQLATEVGCPWEKRSGDALRRWGNAWVVVVLAQAGNMPIGKHQARGLGHCMTIRCHERQGIRPGIQLRMSLLAGQEKGVRQRRQLLNAGPGWVRRILRKVGREPDRVARRD